MNYEGLLAPDVARARLIATATPVTTPQAVALQDAYGRRLVSDLVATHDLPATANAAVDGYAVHARILSQNPDRAFPVVGRAAAGHPFDREVAEGDAIRIFTGAVMPIGPDAVAMHEHCEMDENTNTVKIGATLKPGSNSRPAGENIASGEIIIPAGKQLGPADIGIAAAAGQTTVTVHRQLRVGVISMGDEIIDPGTRPNYGQSYDSNRPMLHALISADGHEVQTFPIVPDDLLALTTAYEEAFASCDVVISSGGASDGDEDHTQAAMKAIGAELIFWRLAMKPGRPIAVASLGNKRLFCLPGNPVAAFVCYRLLASPVIDVMAGGVARPLLRVSVQAGFDHKKAAGRAEYLRVRLDTDQEGEAVMRLHGRRGAGVLSSLTGADGLVEIPVENTGVTEGDYLPFIPFREAGL